MAVHTILPPSLTDAVDEVLRAAGVGMSRTATTIPSAPPSPRRPIRGRAP
jgi:hypothetical protein